MSRTYKKYTGHCFRNPHGRRQALIAGGRKRAIPPNAYDDIPFDRQCYLPQKVADGLAAKGEGYQEIIQHLMKKFGVRLTDAEWMAEWAVVKERKRVPEGLLALYGEKKVKE